MSIAADVPRGPSAVKLAPPPALSYVGAEGPMTSLSPVLALLHLVWSQQPDSLTTLRAARRAQATFEAIRRQHLPYGSGHAGGPCDLRIGRFCYWYDDDRSPPEHPPAEPQPIRNARATLLAALDDAGARLPGDEWIAGQRVRYRSEEHTSELQSPCNLVCRLLLEKKKNKSTS